VGRNYRCVMCGKVRSAEEFRAELTELWAALEEEKKLARTAVAAPPAPAVSACAWTDCEEPPRSNSKYCSRSCSNKNARLRHSQRRSTAA